MTKTDSFIPLEPSLGDARLLSMLRLWFGVSEPVSRPAYAVSGFGWMLLKYGVEGLVIWCYTAAFFSPLDFLNPLLSIRTETLRTAPEWVAWAQFAWTIPFLWIAISMSVRRVADAGLSPWLGLLVLVPLVNLLFMLAMCAVRSKPGEHWSSGTGTTSDDQRARSAVFGVGAGLVIGGVMFTLSVFVFQSYGASLFLGTPLLMGAAGAYVFNHPHPRSYWASASVGQAAVFFAGVALLLFALEGLICVMMAVPLVVPFGALGGVLGKAIAESTRRPRRELVAAIAILPLLSGAESLLIHSAEYEVMTMVEVNAPADAVWEHVVRFPDLPEQTAWYYRMGIACPQRARIVGKGVGATRYCEFTTGTFVEPITVWEPGKRLAFDVTDQPAPMFELSPYRHIHPPHLDGYLRSTRGEFLLIGLPDGRTRVEGRTWYQFDMFPQWYWTLWSDLLIHRIHQRVLAHVKHRAEQSP
ncbi:MAG: DUF805 domain-containing protein [Pirellulales bacterium]